MNRESAMEVARFMATPMGRNLRIGLGMGMIALGVSRRSSGGYLLAGMGLIPIFAGMANVCLVAPFIGVPLLGEEVE